MTVFTGNISICHGIRLMEAGKVPTIQFVLDLVAIRARAVLRIFLVMASIAIALEGHPMLLRGMAIPTGQAFCVRTMGELEGIHLDGEIGHTGMTPRTRRVDVGRLEAGNTDCTTGEKRCLHSVKGILRPLEKGHRVPDVMGPLAPILPEIRQIGMDVLKGLLELTSLDGQRFDPIDLFFKAIEGLTDGFLPLVQKPGVPFAVTSLTRLPGSPRSPTPARNLAVF